jgi:hypothetical protein
MKWARDALLLFLLAGLIYLIFAVALVPFFSTKGAIVALIIAALLFVFLLILPEWVIPRLHRAQVAERQRGLQVSYARVLESLRFKQGPQLWLFASPSPQALCARSWGGRGVILVSQGLLSVTQEEDLRRVLRTAVLECRGIGRLRSSVYALVAALLVQVAPRSWSRFAYSPRMRSRDLREHTKSAQSALAFFALWFWINFFRSKSSRTRSTTGYAHTYFSASHKQGLVWEEALFPAFEALQLIEPLRR